ncbi:LysM peptidoglycan-binding domain-containing protein [Weissella coleopterorum]|uniref:LysM peptidoglycan-binding domain-containing protein n=1 Tax=Weissella coleopterorum TaxID=2714949 RepID=A0A6G8B1B7_9LACO|nr:LysM domain-containing protein [Weissella coleopterorum]QIL51009.1 LysM peptidoglycan-binding domain-containing protein [Weissella coleopterorum]
MSKKAKLALKRIFLSVVMFVITFFLAFAITRGTHKLFHRDPTTANATSSKITHQVTSSSSSKKATSQKASTSKHTTTYTVEAGDTLASITAKFNTTSKELKKLNSKVDWEALKMGQVIKVPQSNNTSSEASVTSTEEATSDSESATDKQTYVVAKGDTWYRVALNNNLTVSALKALNPNVSSLKTGASIRIK